MTRETLAQQITKAADEIAAWLGNYESSGIIEILHGDGSRFGASSQAEARQADTAPVVDLLREASALLAADQAQAEPRQTALRDKLGVKTHEHALEAIGGLQARARFTEDFDTLRADLARVSGQVARLTSAITDFLPDFAWKDGPGMWRLREALATPTSAVPAKTERPFFYGAKATAITPPYLALRTWDDQHRRCTQIIMDCKTAEESAAWADRLNRLLGFDEPKRMPLPEGPTPAGAQEREK